MKILVPLDGSALAESALAPALALLAQAAPPRMLVVSRIVDDTLTIPDVTAVDLALEETDRVHAYLQTVPLPTEDVVVTHKVGLGHAATVIALQAAEEQADLIVMTTHGRTGLARIMLGSVAEGTVQHASMPVLLVRGMQTTELSRSNGRVRVLVPLDGTPATAAILPALRALWHDWQMDVTLLTVISASAPATAVKDAQAVLVAIAVRLQDQAPEAHVTYETLVGTPAESIPQYCQHHPMELIALSYRHQRLAERLFSLNGTVAACLAHTTLPIFIHRVPAPEPTQQA